MLYINRRRSHRPASDEYKYSEVRSSMQTVFDESLALSFQKVVKQSVLEIFIGNGMTAFQESLRDGVHNICCTVQQRLMEVIDSELRNDISLRNA